MPSQTITELAQQIREALVASASLKPLADQLYAELGTFAVAQLIDTGPDGEFLVALPGYGPLSDPTQYLHPGQRL